jgi:cell division septum initiation protein DivIVA
MSVGAVGSSEQLSQILGNNTQLIENKTAIGNPSLGNLTASTNATMDQLGENASEIAPGLLNKTGEVAKKIIGGAADAVTNITSEIKEGVGAK